MAFFGTSRGCFCLIRKSRLSNIARTSTVHSAVLPSENDCATAKVILDQSKRLHIDPVWNHLISNATEIRNSFLSMKMMQCKGQWQVQDHLYINIVPEVGWNFNHFFP